MEAIALAATIKKAIEIGGYVAAEGASCLCWLQEEVTWICTEMARIQHFLRDADANPSEISGLENLRREIRDLAYDIEDIMDTHFPNIVITPTRRKGLLGCLKRTSCCFCDKYTEINFVMEVKAIKKKVEDINRARTTFNVVADMSARNRRVEMDPRRLFLHVEEPNLVGFDSQIRDLVARLQSPKVKFDVISIVGIPGIGKTTLGKQVFKSAKVRSGFGSSALVYVSQEPDVRGILRDMAKQVGLDMEEGEQNLEANLFKFLRARRYLIFLDDIWSCATWDALKIALPTHSGNGSRIIVSTRNTDVGRYIGGESSLHELLPLARGDSWKLFSKILLIDIKNEMSVSTSLVSIGKEIVNRCSGLPLAIVLIAGLLLSRERTEHAWGRVLESIQQVKEDKCSKILALSYKDLPIELKPCFLYFGLFPEDHQVSAFQLINLWMAERFIVAEDIGWDYLNNLAARNLIQVTKRRFDGRITSCCIHDLLHALSISIAHESNFCNTLTHLPSNFGHTVRRVSNHRCGISDHGKLYHQIPKIRAFLSFSDGEVFNQGSLNGKPLPTFCVTFRFLRVLLTRTQTPCRIPKELGCLSHLRYLELRGFGSQKLPATISNLRNLLTVDVKEQCESLNIPTSIWKMEQLRHILISDDVCFYNPLFEGSCGGLRNMGIFSSTECSLPNLQTLLQVHASSLKATWLHKFSSLKKLGIQDPTKEIVNVLSNTLPLSQKLENLRLSWSLTLNHEDSTTKLDLSLYEHLSKLHLEGHRINLPKPITFPKNLKKLTFKFTELRQKDMEMLKRLPGLKILKMDYYSYKGRILVLSGANCFPQLEVLEIRFLTFLEELIAEDGGMPRLKKLVINYCHKLKTVSNRLQDVMISDCYDEEELLNSSEHASSFHSSPSIELS